MNCSKEALLDELTDFANQKPAEIPSVLDEYLCHIAKTGDTLFSWHKLKPLLCRKLELVMNEFHKVSPTDDLPALPNVEAFKYEEMKEKVLEAVNCFNSAPFTIQRLCELVVDPRKHYKRTDKFMRGLEKNVLVVSTIEPRSLVALQQANAAAMPMVNGIPGAEDGGINGHFGDTTEDSLNRLDGENGHCEDEGICADDPGEAPQPVTEEVVEEQEVEASAVTEQTTTESSSKCEKEEEAEPSAPGEQEAEVDKEEQPQAAEEVAVETPAESSECVLPSNDEESVTQAEEEPEKETPAEESVVDKDATEEVAEASSESGAEDVSGTREEPSSEPAAEELSVPAEEHSEADALPLDASEPKPTETSNEAEEASVEADCCDSSISEMPENEELKEPPRKKFHPEPETRTEDQEIEEQEQPSSTSVSMDDTVEEEAMESSKPDGSPVEDSQAEAMDTTADSSAQKDSPIEEELAASPDESAMDQD